MNSGTKRPLVDGDGQVRELNGDDFAAMRPATEARPGLVKRHRGKQKASTKRMTSIRFDAPVKPYFEARARARGSRWQSELNAAVLAYMAEHPLDDEGG